MRAWLSALLLLGAWPALATPPAQVDAPEWRYTLRPGDTVVIGARHDVMLAHAASLGTEVQDRDLMDFPVAAMDVVLTNKALAEQTLADLARRAGEILDAGWPVIVDATFTARWQRDLLREAARTRNVEFRIVDFPVPVATLRERIVQRSRSGNDASEADLAVLQHQLDTEEPLGADEQSEIVSTHG